MDESIADQQKLIKWKTSDKNPNETSSRLWEKLFFSHHNIFLQDKLIIWSELWQICFEFDCFSDQNFKALCCNRLNFLFFHKTSNDIIVVRVKVNLHVAVLFYSRWQNRNFRFDCGLMIWTGNATHLTINCLNDRLQFLYVLNSWIPTSIEDVIDADRTIRWFLVSQKKLKSSNVWQFRLRMNTPKEQEKEKEKKLFEAN